MGKLQELAGKYYWIGLIVIAGWAWMAQHDAAVRFSALAEARQQELVERQLDLHKRDQLIAQHDSVVTLQNAQLKVANMRISQRISETATTVHNEVTDLRLTLDSVQQTKLDSVVQHYSSIINLKDQQLLNLANIIRSDSIQVSDKNNQLANYRKLTDDMAKQIDKLTDHAHPSLMRKFAQIAPWAITGGAIFLGLTKK